MSNSRSSASKPRPEQPGVFRPGRAEIADEMKCRLKLNGTPEPKRKH